jgi:hypothetical protein
MVDTAGKEAPLRRARLRLLAGFAADFYRSLIRALSGAAAAEDAALQGAVDAAVRSGWHDVDQAAASLERTIDAANQIDRNAHLTTLVEAWIDDLGVLARGGAVRPMAVGTT